MNILFNRTTAGYVLALSSFALLLIIPPATALDTAATSFACATAEHATATP
jgi:hypothetical protein